MSGPPSRTHLVLYDGVCGLCDRTVQFLLRNDRKLVLSFAQLQGETAARLGPRLHPPGDLETVIFVEDFSTESQRISYRSTGVLRMLNRIGGFWRVLSWLRVVPRPIRDLAYRVVARYRYRWFGRFDTCQPIDASVADRFLDRREPPT